MATTRSRRKTADVSSIVDAAIDKKLKSSCLGPEHRALMRVGPADADELASWGQPQKMAMEIPYFDLAGEPNGFKRVRYLEDVREGFAKVADAKELRYVQPPESLPQVYFPPLLDASWADIANDADVSVVATEGELKAACGCACGFPTFGLGGVWNFRAAKSNIPFISDLKAFKWAGRKVVIVYDSDAADNQNVAKACNALARELVDRGAKVYVADVPSASDGEKQGLDDLVLARGQKALERVIGEAHQFEASQVLHELNAEVAYVRDPGLVHVYKTGQKLSPSNFVQHAYSNRHIIEWVEKQDGSRTMKKSGAARAWLDWPHRAEFARMTFAPGKAERTIDGELNTWPGWGCEPKRGSIEPWRKLLDHLFGEEKAARDWFERWLALPLQRPGSKMFTAAVLWGVSTGTGKSLVGYTMKRIYGETFTEIGDTELQDPRNAWAVNKQFVLGDDVTGHEQRKLADRLKKMITQQEIRIDEKYVPTYVLPDFVNYLFTSNHPDAFFLEDDDRRMFVHEVLVGPMAAEFYEAYVEWLRGDGGPALFYHLLHLDLGGMKASDRAPRTAAKERMTEDGLSDLGRWVRRLKEEPDAVLKFGSATLAGDLWTAKQLMSVYDPGGTSRVTQSAMSRELKRAGIHLVYGGNQVRTADGRARLFAVRNAEQWSKLKDGKKAAAHYDETRAAPAAAAGPKPRKF